MNQEIKAKWVEALRSGEYKQGTRYLNSEEGFCCLGVLTDLYIKENGLEWKKEEGCGGLSFQNGLTILPQSVHQWSELETPLGHIDSIGNRSSAISSLADLNDGARMTFPQIADVIEYAL